MSNKKQLNDTIKEILKNALAQLFPDNSTSQVWINETGKLTYKVTVKVTVGAQVFKREYNVNLLEVIDLAGLGNSIVGEVKQHFGVEAQEVEAPKKEKRVKNG